MSKTINLDQLIKDVACTTVDSMMISPKKFNNDSDALEYYQEYLPELIKKFTKSFEVDVQNAIEKHLANT